MKSENDFCFKITNVLFAPQVCRSEPQQQCSTEYVEECWVEQQEQCQVTQESRWLEQ